MTPFALFFMLTSMACVTASGRLVSLPNPHHPCQAGRWGLTSGTGPNLELRP